MHLGQPRAHRTRRGEIAPDLRTLTDHATLDPSADGTNRRIRQDDRPLDLRAVDSRSRPDRRVGPDVRVRPVSASAAIASGPFRTEVSIVAVQCRRPWGPSCGSGVYFGPPPAQGAQDESVDRE